MLPVATPLVDLETTGTLAGDDRVTEVGIVRVDDASLHLLDGTYLGRLKDVRVDLGFRPEDYRQ